MRFLRTTRGRLVAFAIAILGAALLLADETVIGVDLIYNTVMINAGDTVPRDWKLALTLCDPSKSSRWGSLIPIEAGRHMAITADWNGGGRQFSNDIGFGVVDADTAVQLARSWTQQSTTANLVIASTSRTAGLPVSGKRAVTSSLPSQAICAFSMSRLRSMRRACRWRT